jgi:hypothetical protein
MGYPTLPSSLKPGLYRARQRRDGKGVAHYGILDVGNRANILGANGFNVVVIHMLPPGIQCEYTNPAAWQDIEKIADESGAIERLESALERPDYDLLGNNCEHFANYIAYGKRQSMQVLGAGVGAGLIGLGIVIANWGDDT